MALSDMAGVIWSIWYGPYRMVHMIWSEWYGAYDVAHMIRNRSK